MKSVATLALAALPALGLCQMKSSLEVSGGAYLTWRTLRTGVDWLDESLRYNEVSTVNWSAGAYYNRQIAPRLYLKTGLQIASIGHRSRQWGLDFSQGDANTTWLIGMENRDLRSLTWVRYATDYIYLGLPVLLRYELLDRKLTPYVEGGVVTSLYIGSRYRQTTNLNTVVVKNPYSSKYIREWQAVGQLSIGLKYRPSDSIELYLQPTLRYHFTYTWPPAELQERMKGVGVQIGLRRSLMN
jgi:hypothetical protein